MTRYSVYSYDPADEQDTLWSKDKWEWNQRYAGFSQFALRKAIRELRNQGYDSEVSIYVEQEETTETAGEKP